LCFNLTDGKMPFATWAKADPFDVRVENGQVLVSRTPRAAQPS
jgi:nitrite reductase/ring-hydroxylating ferredoxin subunit